MNFLKKILNSIKKPKEKPFKGKFILFPKNNIGRNWKSERVPFVFHGPVNDSFPTYWRGKKVKTWVELSKNQDESQNDTVYFGPTYYKNKK